MARVTVLCGKVAGACDRIAAGMEEGGRCVVLACDELTQARYDRIHGLPLGASARMHRDELIGRAAELAGLGIPVVLHCFLPTARDRSGVLRRLRDAGLDAEMVYVPGDGPSLRGYLAGRALRAAQTGDPFLCADAETVHILNGRFVPPAGDEEYRLFLPGGVPSVD